MAVTASYHEIARALAVLPYAGFCIYTKEECSNSIGVVKLINLLRISARFSLCLLPKQIVLVRLVVLGKPR